ATGQLAHELLDGGHARRAADEHDVVDVALAQARVADRLLERTAARLEQVGRQLLELGARQAELEVQRAVARRGDERQVDRRLRERGQLDLRLLRGLLQTLRR